MNDVQSSLRRTFKYLIPVSIISVVINLPKFFEAKVITYEVKNGNETKVELAVTDLRKNPDYAIYYSNWTRFLCIGGLPFVMLIWFNLKIYQDIKVLLFKFDSKFILEWHSKFELDMLFLRY